MMDWLKEEMHREYHEVAQIFPFMQGDEFEQLKDDIAANGLLKAIWLHPNGRIIDGRNRHRACIETETEPCFKVWDGDGSLVSFVVSMNLHWRHLTSSQLAVVAADILPLLEVEAGARQRATRFGAGGGAKNCTTDKGKARDQAATIAGTNRQYVSDAKKLKQEAPELFEQVREGHLTIPQAKRELVKRQRAKAPPLPTDKYRILYADPPWKYGDAGIIGETDHYGHVHRHYPSLSIQELCEMGEGIKDITAKDAVLFMWVTSPLLAECFDVITAWGFKYKTSFVWDKVGHNYGHYNSVRHELLLVCTRGSCLPDAKELIDSVQSIPKSKTHSEKPERFREIIDTLYTQGKRIELFARMEKEGWEGWGNEPG